MPTVLIPLIAAVLPAIGPVALAGAGAGFATGTWALATVISYAAFTAATLGASLLLERPKPKGNPQQVTVKQSLPPRVHSYGRVKIGGAFAFISSKNAALHQLTVHGEGPWDGIEEWWLNDINASPSGGVVFAFPWRGYVFLESKLGEDDQESGTIISSVYSSIWTENHRLRGLAYTVSTLLPVKQEAFGQIYPNGAPALRVVARTAKLYDPRTDATAFSENPALEIRDYLTRSRGFNIPAAMIDDPSFAAFADICDEDVLLSGGGEEPRYRCAMTYDLSAEPREVLRLLLASCDAEIYPTAEGKVAIRGGVWEAPTATLGPDQILSYHYEQGNDRLAAFNRLKLTFCNREADYQPFEIDPWEDLASQAQVGVLSNDLTLEQVPSWTQARRLGKIFSARQNPRHKLTLRTNLGGLLALGERCVHVTLPELDLDDDFYVESFTLSGDLASCDLVLSSLPEETYDWSPSTEEGTAPVAPGSTPDADVPPLPTGLEITLERIQPSAGVWQTRIRASVDEVTDTPWTTIGRLRPVGESTWTAMSSDGDWRVISGVVEDGRTYEVQVAHAGFSGEDSGNIGPYTDVEEVEITADNTPAGDVTSFTVTPGGTGATITWVNPSSLNYYATEVGRALTGDPVAWVRTVYGAAGGGQIIGDDPGAGTYDWWVRTVNRSGVRSTPLGPFAETVA